MREFWKAFGNAIVALLFSIGVAFVFVALPYLNPDIPLWAIAIIMGLVGTLFLVNVFDFMAACARMISIWMERR